MFCLSADRYLFYEKEVKCITEDRQGNWCVILPYNALEDIIFTSPSLDDAIDEAMLFVSAMEEYISQSNS